MERYCTLCGGKLVNGKCTECGLDNTKDDRKYNLNTHNDKGLKLHEDDCEEHLNRTNRKTSGAEKKTAKPEKKSGPSAGSGYSGTVRTGTARAKQLKERRQTGTVKKKRKHHWILWIIVLVYLLSFLAENGEDVSELVNDLGTELGITVPRTGSLEDQSRDLYEADEEEADDSSALPGRTVWDTDAGGYYEETVYPGYYTVGYDIPEGTYQFVCETGTAWIEWENNGDDIDSESGYAYLISGEAAEEYDFYDSDSYGACSENILFQEGAEIRVDASFGSVLLAGESTGSLKVRPSQNISGTFELNEDQTELEAGSDLPEGTYHIRLNGTDGMADVEIRRDGEDDSYESYYLDKTGEEARNIPLEKGDRIQAGLFGENISVILTPSY